MNWMYRRKSVILIGECGGRYGCSKIKGFGNSDSSGSLCSPGARPGRRLPRCPWPGGPRSGPSPPPPAPGSSTAPLGDTWGAGTELSSGDGLNGTHGGAWRRSLFSQNRLSVAAIRECEGGFPGCPKSSTPRTTPYPYMLHNSMYSIAVSICFTGRHHLGAKIKSICRSFRKQKKNNFPRVSSLKQLQWHSPQHWKTVINQRGQPIFLSPFLLRPSGDRL